MSISISSMENVCDNARQASSKQNELDSNGEGVMYGPLIIAYLFLGGASAGGFFMMAVLDLIRLRRGCEASSNVYIGNWRATQAFEQFRGRTYAACFLLLALSMLFLFWDLGVPERVLYIFLHPHATVLTFGSVSLVAELAVGGLLAFGSVFRMRAKRAWVHRALTIICCLVSLATMAYTGAFLMSNIGIAFWNTWTIVLLFVSSSLSCGTALVLLSIFFANERVLESGSIRLLHACHLAFIAIEAISIALFLLAAFANPSAANACEMLLSPRILSTAIVGVVGFGLAIPAACEAFALLRRGSATTAVADAFCLCGGLLLRFIVITCGVY